MRFTLTRASKHNSELKDEKIDIKTLEDLMKIVKREGDVVISEFWINDFDDGDPTIVIYDDYLE